MHAYMSADHAFQSLNLNSTSTKINGAISPNFLLWLPAKKDDLPPNFLLATGYIYYIIL